MVCLTAKDSKKLLLETDLGPFLVALRTFRVKGVAGSQVLFLTQTKPGRTDLIPLSLAPPALHTLLEGWREEKLIGTISS